MRLDICRNDKDKDYIVSRMALMLHCDDLYKTEIEAP